LYRVPYDDFVRNESLKAFFRKGVNDDKTAPRCYPGASFYELCAAFAQSFDVTLFLLEMEDEAKTLTVFNRGAGDKKCLVMFRVPQNLIALSRTPRCIDREVDYEPITNEEEEEEEDEEESMDAQDLPDQNWAAPAKRYKTAADLVKNVVYIDGTLDVSELPSGDLVVKLADRYEINTLHQVCCFGVDKKVVFRQGVIYKQPSVLHVPGGFGTAMEHGGAADVYLLTGDNAVIKKINLYRALRNLLTKSEWSVDVDRYVQNFRATSYAGGECLYTYARPDKNMVEYTDGFDGSVESVHEMSMRNTLLSTPESPLISTPANALELSKVAVVAARKEDKVKKMPETVVDAFYVFLLKAGVTVDVDELDPHDAFVNVNEININAIETDGTLKIDLSTFVTPGIENEKIFLELVNWVEQKTGAIYPRPYTYIIKQ